MVYSYGGISYDKAFDSPCDIFDMFVREAKRIENLESGETIRKRVKESYG